MAAEPGRTGTAVGPWTPVLSARVELALPGKPEGVLIADADGDGVQELWSTTRSPGALLCWKGLSDPPRSLAIPAYPLGPLLARGAQGARLVLASRADSLLLWIDATRLDEGDACITNVAATGRPRAIGVGDLDGDGVDEVCVATREGELIVARDGLVLAKAPLLDAQATLVVVSRGTILVGSQGGRSMRTYYWNPPQRILAAQEATQLDGIPRAHLAVNWGAQGAPVNLIAGGEQGLWILSADGFEVRNAGVLPGRIPLDLEVIAMPGSVDGVLALGFNDLSYSVLGPDSVRSRGYAGQDPWDASIGDLNGDGWPDLAIANRDALRVSIIMNDGAGAFAAGARVAVPRGPHAVACGDLNGDGQAEVLSLSAGELQLAIIGTSGAKPLLLKQEPAGPAPDRLRCADVDGDGNLDAAWLVRGEAGTALRLRFGDGQGGLHARSSVPDRFLGGASGDLCLCDLDGDGTLEALVADPEGSRVTWMRPLDGGVGPSGSLPLITAPRALCALRAVDGGRTEIAVALGLESTRIGAAILRLEGAGKEARLVEIGFHPVQGCLPIDVAAADLSGDGRDELIILCKALRSDGPGRLLVAGRTAEGPWRALAEQTTGLRPYGLAAGDIDGDGLADLIVGAQNSHNINAWRATKKGLVRWPDLGAVRGVLDVELFDLDGDGRMEVIAANSFSDDLSILRH